MRKIDFLDLIQETIVELATAEKIQSNARIRLRVQFLRLLKSGQASQLKQAALIVGISAKHASSLWKKYRAGGFEQLLKLHYKAGVSRLSPAHQAKLLDKAKSGFRSQREAREYLRQAFGTAYTQQGISVLFERLKIKAKVPRPANVKAVPEEQSAYKKTFSGG